MNYKETMTQAVEAILGKQVGDKPLALPCGMMIRKGLPNARTSWSLFCNRNGKDFLVINANGVYAISVGEPGTHWLKRQYYVVYRQ